MYHILICDDQPEVAAAVAEMADRLWQEAHTTRTFTNQEALRGYLQTNGADSCILILDIQLGHENSIAFSRRLLEDYPQLPLIFMTGYATLGGQIFESRPCDFLTKPVQEHDLLRALGHGADCLQTAQRSTMMISSRAHGTIRLFVSDIIYLEASMRQLLFHTENGVYSVRGSIADYEPLFPAAQFTRCHQSFLVNLNYVRQIDGLRLLLRTGASLPISKARVSAFKQSFTDFLGGSL